MSRRYDDHYGSGPYHSEGTFYPSGHPSTHRSSSRSSGSSSTYHSSSAYSSGRASNDPHHRRDRPHCPSPSPPRAYSPPSPARDSRSSNTHSSCTERESAQSSQPPPCPESQQQPFTSSRDTSTVAYTYDDEEPDTIPHAPAPWNNFASFSTREKLVSFFVSQGFSKETAEKEVGREFWAHAPQHRSGEVAGPSRYQAQASTGTRPGHGGARGEPRRGRSPSPIRFSRDEWRTGEREI
jgi:hypothetical protein